MGSQGRGVTCDRAGRGTSRRSRCGFRAKQAEPEEISVRSDDDSWDITESVGATAIGVAAMRAAETRRPDALFRDPYAARLVEAAGSGWSHIMRAQIAAAPGGAVTAEREGTADSGDNRSGADGPGATEDRPVYSSLAAMLIARTVYFDEYFAAASAAGIRQVVILASGL